jgi:hypothetical protein
VSPSQLLCEQDVLVYVWFFVNEIYDVSLFFIRVLYGLLLRANTQESSITLLFSSFFRNMAAAAVAMGGLAATWGAALNDSVFSARIKQSLTAQAMLMDPSMGYGNFTTLVRGLANKAESAAGRTSWRRATTSSC